MTTVRFALLSLALLFSACIVISEEAPAPTEGENAALVTGRLVQGADLQQAAAGRDVELVGGQTFSASTNDDGGFVFDAVPAGKYELRTDLPAPASATAESHAARVTEVTVTRGRNDLGSLPLPGGFTGKVTLVGQTDHTGVDVFIPGGSFIAKSDADGNYSLVGMAAGTYKLRFSKEGFTDQQLDAVAVVSGEVTAVDEVELAADGSTGAMLSGKVFHFDGPSAGATITLSGGSLQAQTTSDGSFAITGIPSGAYDVTFTLSDGWASGMTIKNLPLQPGNPVTLPNFTFGRGEVIAEGLPEAVSADGRYVSICNESASARRVLDTSDGSVLEVGSCMPGMEEAYFGETILVVYETGASATIIDLATGSSRQINEPSASNLYSLTVVGDAIVFSESGWASPDTYFFIADKDTTTPMPAVPTSVGQIAHVTPDASHFIARSGTIYDGASFPIGSTYSAFSIPDGAATELGSLFTDYSIGALGSDANGVYFFSYDQTKITHIAFPSLTTSVVAAGLPSLNASYYDELNPSYADYPMDFTSATERLVYIGNDAVYAVSFTNSTWHEVASFGGTISCTTNDWCEVSILPGGNEVMAFNNMNNYHGPITPPAALPSPATALFMGGTPTGTNVYYTAAGLQYEPASGPAVLVGNPEYLSDIWVAGNTLYYLQPLIFNLSSPLFNYWTKYLVRVPLP